VTLNGGKHRRKGIYFPYFRICGYEKSLRAIDGVTLEYSRYSLAGTNRHQRAKRYLVKPKARIKSAHQRNVGI
jgi:hypothetical protein